MIHKKIILLTFLSIMFLMSSASSSTAPTRIDSSFNGPIVFAEYTTATWCPQCPISSESLYSLQTENPSFFFVSLVVDKNQVAQKRAKDFTNYAVPSVYFDGGYHQYIGNNGVLLNEYSNLINECFDRTDRHLVTINGEIEVLENNVLKLSIELTNNDDQTYFGRIRSYITEKESRWNDNEGNHYHFSLLDFAFDQRIKIKNGETILLQTEWDPTDTISEDLFSDVSTDNLLILTSVSHWQPHFRSGFIQFPYIQFYFAHYLDNVLPLEP